jgi:RNA polymerase sigma-70 factor (ECF subfamily)
MYRMKETATDALHETADLVSRSAPDVADETLAEAARAGDHAAFDQIFERHRRRVARLAGRFFNRPERVEEILQEVFTKVYFNLDAYSPDRGHSFSAWLSRVTINACYDELRRARRRPESSVSDITTDEADWINVQLQGKRSNAESAVISRDLANKLLARLSSEDRLVLTLLDAEEMTVAEIAVVMGWKVSKVKVRAHRARHSLRRVLGEFL